MQSKLFDHRAITLEFSCKKDQKIRKPAISKSILKDDNLDIVVFAAVCETHLHHLDTVGMDRQLINDKLAIIGNIKMLIRAAGSPSYLPK